MDKSKILEELGGIPEEVYDSLVLDLVEQTGAQIEKMRAAVEMQDWKNLVEIAHFIKGSAGNLRIAGIEAPAREIEMSAREQKNASGISSAITLIEERLSGLSSPNQQ